MSGGDTATRLNRRVHRDHHRQQWGASRCQPGIYVGGERSATDENLPITIEK